MNFMMLRCLSPCPPDPTRAPIQSPHSLPPLRTTTISIRPDPISSLLTERAQSIYLDVLDGSRGVESGHGSRDGTQTLRASLSIDRRGSTDNIRLSSIDEALENAERVRRLAEDPTALRQGGARRASKPIMVPLPASPASAHPRPMSALSRNLASPGTVDLNDEEEVLDAPNPFALPAPPPELGSRFDPKVLSAQRRDSFDSEVQSRPQSRLSLAPVVNDPVTQQAEQRSPQRPYDDIPTPEQFGRPLMPQRCSTSFNRMNRQSLLRPQTLIMPAPLSGAPPPIQPQRNIVPEGFVLGEKPLPPGRRTSILSGERRRALPLCLSQNFRSGLLGEGKREQQYPVDEVGGEVEVDADLDEQVEMTPERRRGKLYVCLGRYSRGLTC